MAKRGKKMDITDIKNAVMVSIVDTIGFPRPPVVVVEARRVTLEEPEMAAAVPPPAITARHQETTGFISTIVDIITAVPAKAASGTEILSKTLSTNGI